MAYRKFEFVRITPAGPSAAEVHLPPGSLQISGSDIVTFRAPLKEGTGNWSRLLDERTRDFVRAMMGLRTVKVVSVTVDGALVRHNLAIRYSLLARFIRYQLAPPADDPNPILADAEAIEISADPDPDQTCWPRVATEDDRDVMVDALRLSPGTGAFFHTYHVSDFISAGVPALFTHGGGTGCCVVDPDALSAQDRADYMSWVTTQVIGGFAEMVELMLSGPDIPQLLILPTGQPDDPQWTMLWAPHRFDYSKTTPDYLAQLMRDPEFRERILVLLELSTVDGTE